MSVERLLDYAKTIVFLLRGVYSVFFAQRVPHLPKKSKLGERGGVNGADNFSENGLCLSRSNTFSMYSALPPRQGITGDIVFKKSD